MKRTIIILACFISLTALSENLFSAGIAQQAGSLIIDRNLSKKFFAGSLSYLIDEDSSLTVDDISSTSFRDRFSYTGKGELSFGVTRSTLWVRFTVDNTEPFPVEWFLEYSYQLIDYVTLYVPGSEGYKAIETGDRKLFKQRPVLYRTFVFPLRTTPGEHTFYLKLRTQGAMNVSLVAWGPSAFQSESALESILFWLFYGLLLGIIIYNFVIYSPVRDPSYVYLGLLLFSFAVATMANNGLLFQYFLPDSPGLANALQPFSIVMTCFLCLLFVKNFIQLPLHMPGLNRVINGFMVILAVDMTMVFYIDYFYIIQFSIALGTALLVFLIYVAVMALGMKLQLAGYNFFALVLIVLVLFFNMLRAGAVIPNIFWLIWSNYSVSVIMALVLSSGIAYRVNYIKREKESALKSLREADKRYKALVEGAREGIMLVTDERVVFVNNSIVNMTGFPEDHFIGKPVYDFFTGAVSEMNLFRKDTAARAGEQSMLLQQEAQMPTADRDILDIIISAAPMSDNEGVSSVVTITDITELKRAHDIITRQFHEIQLQCEEVDTVNRELTMAHTEMFRANESLLRETEKLSITLKSIGEGVFTVDPGGRIDMMNRAAENIIGYSQDEVRGRDISDIVALRTEHNPEDIDLKKLIFQGDTGGFIDEDFVIVDKTGNTKYVLPIISQIKNTEDEIIGAVLVFNDITQRKKMEEEILKTSKIESLGVFAGGIAHDFNNLLTAIVGNISLVMLDMDKENRNYKYLSDAEKVIVRATDLTQQLLTFSKGGAPVKKASSVRDLLRDTVDFVLSGSNVKAEFDIQEDLWNGEIDVGQISQVIQNLILNAMQSMPGGGAITITAANVHAGDREIINFKHKNFIKISIKDTGEGIPQEHINKIFDPFFTTKPKGNGLGLSICYSIIQKHGGYITVTSEKNRGSTFHLFLPASQETVEISRRENNDFHVNGRALFMDDEEFIRNVGSRMLRRIGLTVDTASDGKEAVDKFKAARETGNAYDYVFVDLTIPGGMGGQEAITYIRKIDPHVKAVASSGYSNDPVMSDYRSYGFDAVISKPYRLPELSDLMKSLSS